MWDAIFLVCTSYAQIHLIVSYFLEIEFLFLLDFAMLSHSKLTSYLPIGCQLLIEKFEEIQFNRHGELVYTEYEIALRPTKRNFCLYQLFLRVDIKKWYEDERQFDRDVASKAKTYINRVRDEEESFAATPHKAQGKKKFRGDNKQQPCKGSVICNRGNKCGFWACDKHTIYKKEGVWYAVIRCNKTGIVTIYPTQHNTNEQFG